MIWKVPMSNGLLPYYGPKLLLAHFQADDKIAGDQSAVVDRFVGNDLSLRYVLERVSRIRPVTPSQSSMSFYFFEYAQNNRDFIRKDNFEKLFLESFSLINDKRIDIVLTKPRLKRFTIGLFAVFVSTIALAALLGFMSIFNGDRGFSHAALYVAAISCLSGMMCSERVRKEVV